MKKSLKNLIKNKACKSYVHNISLVCVIVFLFANTIKGGFVYDDFDLVIKNQQIRYWHFWDLWSLWGRSTRTFSLMIDYHLFGETPYGYHYQNILWHILSTILLYSLCAKLSGDYLLSFFCAILFAAHPVHVETVANIANRKESLCMFFSLSSFLFYIQHVNEESKTKWVWLILSILSWYLALNSKQVAIVLPFALVAYEYIYFPKEKGLYRKRILLSAILLLLGMLSFFLFQVKGVEFGKGGYDGDLSLYSAIVSFPWVFLKNIKLLFFPFNLSPDHILQIPSSLVEPGILISWIIFIGIIFFFFYFVFAQRDPFISIGLFWIMLHYLPISSIVPTTYFVAERYLYIPSAGFCMIIGAIMHKIYKALGYPRKRNLNKIVHILFTGILILYSVKTIKYNVVWQNNRNLWAYTLKVTPKSFVAYYGIGNEHLKSNNFIEAVKYYSKATDLNPSYKNAYLNRGNAYKLSGYYSRAISDYNRVLVLDSQDAGAYHNRGIAQSALGNYDEAVSDFSRAITIRPSFAKSYYNRGVAHVNWGDYKAAIKDYSKAVEIDPQYALAYYNLGLIYLDLGNAAKANSYFEKASILDSRLKAP